MKRVITYPIENTTTVGDFLKEQGYSHAVLVHLKKTPYSLMCQNKWVYVRNVLQKGDLLTVTLEETDCSKKIVPVPLPLDIVYEDEDIMVVNKPANMPIHPSLNNYENTLANAVAYYLEQKNEPCVFRCINRLDRDTTGLTVLAKHMLSASVLSKAVANREISRTYLAIVDGELTGSGTIDAPIAREADSAITRCVDFERGERAVTHYEVLATSNGLSFVSLKLETGRTHQIRVHMKYLGYPLIGDYLYHPNTEQMQRQALHSFRLSFVHPVTKKAMEFTAPLPLDMASLFPA